MAASVIALSISGAAVGDPAVTGSALPQREPAAVLDMAPRDSRAAVPECIHRLRRAVVNRRAAAWAHQDVLELRRDRTARRARTAKSCAYLRYVRKMWATRAHTYWRIVVSLRDPEAAIRFVFREHAREALTVARCESRLDVWARNGQYLGLFQMGDYARGRYGHGWSALEQTRAAYAYFRDAGWAPWQCSEHGGLRW